MQRPRVLALLFAVTLAAPSCQGVRTLADPTLVMQTSGGSELGVSTDYGIVFLGRTARSGPVQVIAWFGDGPNIEKTVIEPVGGGVYTAETEIRLPHVEMSFEDPLPGTKLLNGPVVQLPQFAGRRGAVPQAVNRCGWATGSAKLTVGGVISTHGVRWTNTACDP